MTEPSKIVLDTNNMNAYGSNPELNFIEKCANDGIIEIFYGGDTYLDLSNDKSNNKPIRLKKFGSKNQVLSTARFDYSVFDLCVFADDDDELLDDALALLIFNNRWAEIVEKRPEKSNSKIDVKLIEASILYKVDFFVTEDKDLLKKSDEINKRYGLKIVNRESMKEFLISLKTDSTYT